VEEPVVAIRTRLRRVGGYHVPTPTPERPVPHPQACADGDEPGCEHQRADKAADDGRDDSETDAEIINWIHILDYLPLSMIILSYFSYK
jgi:hypothetical protein